MVYPLIIIGCHRSGTSLLSRVLSRCGLFMGDDLNVHAESKLFLSLNERVYSFAHAFWDSPETLDYLLSSEELCRELAAELETILSSQEGSKYWGPQGGSFDGSVRKESAWGWKDPRSSYTLPLWTRIFPSFSVLHVVRNGVDVAQSLYRREHNRQARMENPIFSCRCFTLSGAFDLWARYEQQCMKMLDSLPADRYLTICYEDFLEAPAEHIERTCRFFQRPLPAETIEAICEDINPARRYSFIDDPMLYEFYEQVERHPVMRRYGYDKETLGRLGVLPEERSLVGL